jgi:hypothetical protein
MIWVLPPWRKCGDATDSGFPFNGFFQATLARRCRLESAREFRYPAFRV